MHSEKCIIRNQLIINFYDDCLSKCIIFVDCSIRVLAVLCLLSGAFIQHPIDKRHPETYRAPKNGAALWTMVNVSRVSGRSEQYHTRLSICV